MSLADRVGESRDAVRRSHVDNVDVDLAIPGREASLSTRLQAVGISGGEYDPGPARRQRFGDRGADALAAADHDGKGAAESLASVLHHVRYRTARSARIHVRSRSR